MGSDASLQNASLGVQMSIAVAIRQLEDALAQAGVGTKQQPQEGTVDWFLVRATAIGLTHLRRMQQLDLGVDYAAAERHYRAAAEKIKAVDVPDPTLVVREVLPNGALPTGAVA